MVEVLATEPIKNFFPDVVTTTASVLNNYLTLVRFVYGILITAFIKSRYSYIWR